ncbi:MAG: peptidylprolyl isomerase [Trueperaceae bacterium]|nr:peptidylprolyl isomerase [Trueperaceae bacterium]
MSRIVALVAVVLALLAIGAWTAFGDRLTPSGSASGVSADASPSTVGGAVGADEAQADGVGGAASDQAGSDQAGSTQTGSAQLPDGFEPVPFLSDAPVQSFERAEPVLQDGLDYRAVVETTAGTLTLDLYEQRVPRTVNNVVFLALHRFYEGVAFHRVIDGFMAQTGDPTGTGSGGPGYTFEDEIVEGLSHDRAGLLSMANAGPDTNGSQFFITFAATPWLDGNHAVFGEVVDGLPVLERLTRVDPQAPSAVARLSEPVSVLAEQGVDEAADAQGTVGDWLAAQLGELPSEGQSFQIVGRRGVLGSAGGAAAVGLFDVPDRIERVTIVTRPQEDPS